MRQLILILSFLVWMGEASASSSEAKVLCEGRQCPQFSLKRRFARLEDANEKKKTAESKSAASRKKSRLDESTSGEGNLPSYMGGTGSVAYIEQGEGFLIETKDIQEKVAGVQSGKTFEAVLEHGFKITEGLEVPVRATITSGQFKGARLVGRAKFEVGLSRATIEFKTLLRGDGEVLDLVSVAVGRDGTYGLLGKIRDHEAKYFLAEMASATAAGIVDSTVDRVQTNDGFESRPGFDTSAKAGATTALSRSADRFARKAESKQRTIEVHPNQRIIVMITESGKLGG